MWPLPVLALSEPSISHPLVKTLDRTAIRYFADIEFCGLVYGRRKRLGLAIHLGPTCLQSLIQACRGSVSMQVSKPVLGSGSRVNMLPASVFSQSPQSPSLRSPSLRGWPPTTAIRTPRRSQASLQRGCRPGGSCVLPVLCASSSWLGRWLVSWGHPSSPIFCTPQCTRHQETWVSWVEKQGDQMPHLG